MAHAVPEIIITDPNVERPELEAGQGVQYRIINEQAATGMDALWVMENGVVRLTPEAMKLAMGSDDETANHD